MDSTGHIIIGVPGKWSDHADIIRSVSNPNSGLIMAGMILHEIATNQSYPVEIYDHDPELSKAFQLAGRGSLSNDELRAIQQHTATVYVIGPKGSPVHARQIMRVGLQLLNAGGLAIKVESSGLAHSVEDWTALAEAPHEAALYHAFVTLIGSQTGFYSCGMHNLGLPDAVVPMTLKPPEAANLLQTFLLYTLLERPKLISGQTFSCDAVSPRYTLRHSPCTLHSSDDPFYNPNGLWWLE